LPDERKPAPPRLAVLQAMECSGRRGGKFFALAMS